MKCKKKKNNQIYNFIKLLIKIWTVRRFHNSIEMFSILENYHFAEFGRVIVNVQFNPTQYVISQVFIGSSEVTMV
jgi:hypothetical protein